MYGGGRSPASPRPIRTPAWVYWGALGLLYRIQVRVMGAKPRAMRSPAVTSLISGNHWETHADGSGSSHHSIVASCQQDIKASSRKLSGRVNDESSPVATPL